MTEDNDELDFGWVDGSEAEESPPAQPAATGDPPAEAGRASEHGRSPASGANGGRAPPARTRAARRHGGSGFAARSR